MNTNVKSIVAASILLVSSIGQAQSQEIHRRMSAKVGPYVSLSTGGSFVGYDKRELSLASGEDEASSTSAGKIAFGYWFSPFVGVEASYMQSGSFEHRFDQGTFRGKARSYGISVLGRYPFKDRWAVVGRVNIAHNRIEDDGSTVGVAQFDRFRGKSTSIAPGVEINYSFAQSAVVFAELDIRGQGGDDAAFGYLGVGLRWTF